MSSKIVCNLVDCRVQSVLAYDEVPHRSHIRGSREKLLELFVLWLNLMQSQFILEI